MNTIQWGLLILGSIVFIGIIWQAACILLDKRTIAKAREQLVIPEADTIIELLFILKVAYTKQMNGERRYGIYRYMNKYEFVFNNNNIAVYGYTPDSQIKLLILQTATFYTKLSSFEYIQIEEPYSKKTLQLIELLRDAIKQLGDEKKSLENAILKDLK